MRQNLRASHAVGILCLATLLCVAGRAEVAIAQTRPASPSPARIPEPPIPFGRVIYRASKAASFETLGVVVIMCRHEDPVPRRFLVQFFDSFAGGKQVSVFGPSVVDALPAGKNVVFVGDATYYPKRDVVNVRIGHFSGGTARVVSDAERVHCMGKMRFDPGARAPTYWRGMGFAREGAPAAPGPDPW